LEVCAVPTVAVVWYGTAIATLLLLKTCLPARQNAALEHPAAPRKERLDVLFEIAR